MRKIVPSVTLAGGRVRRVRRPFRVSTRDEHVLDFGRFGRRTAGAAMPVQVHLPACYDEDDRAYPVLYMLDGQNVFDAATAFAGQPWDADKIHDTLHEADFIRPFVIAAIGSDHRRDDLYTPVVDPDEGGGGLRKLERMIVTELDPALRDRFRILEGPENCAVMGSSLGGLAAFHLAWRRPDTFGKAGVLSPSLWWGRGHTQRLVRAESGPLKPMRVWLDCGTEEDEADEDQDVWFDDFSLVRSVLDLAEVLLDRGHEVRFLIDQGADHSEAAWRHRLPQAFVWLFGTTDGSSLAPSGAEDDDEREDEDDEEE